MRSLSFLDFLSGQKLKNAYCPDLLTTLVELKLPLIHIYLIHSLITIGPKPVQIEWGICESCIAFIIT